MNYNKIPIYSSEDFVGMRKAGALASYILDKLKDIINPGISTEKINKFCHRIIIENGAIPAPLNYKGFPKSICTSVNHVVCHGIPSENKILQNGDIVNADITVILNGWHGDSSRMFAAGKINKNENILDSCVRELSEETNILSDKDSFVFLGLIDPYPGVSTERHYVFKIRIEDDIKDFNGYDDSDRIFFSYASFEKIETLINSNFITDAKTISAYSLFKYYLNNKQV